MNQEAGKVILILREENGRLKATSTQVLAEERKLVKLARNSRGTKSRLGKKGGGGPGRAELSADQRTALDKMLASTDFITLFEAPAGTGKTRTATALRNAVADTGETVRCRGTLGKGGKRGLASGRFRGG